MIAWDDWFYYDETSPSCLRWKVARFAGNYQLIKVGDMAGTISGQVYYRVQLNNSIYTVHRIIWEMFFGNIPEGYEIDHYDLDERNNRIDNLRLVTKQVNCRNRSLRVDSTSGICGISRRERVLSSGTVFVSWVAKYTDIWKKRHYKEFAVNKHGEEGARQLALAFVHKMRLENQQEDCYSFNHGLPKSKQIAVSEYGSNSMQSEGCK